jgi:hypothetical protein
MMKKCYFVFFIVLALAVLPVIALALPLGSGRLVSVTPVYGGCVSGPTGGTVQAWDVERGDTYTLTLTNSAGRCQCGDRDQFPVS